MKKTLLTLIGLAALSLAGVHGQLVYIDGNYTQNFNTLPSSGNETWTNNSTLAGWYAAAPLLSPTAISAQTGSSTTGVLASFGAASNSNRSIGWVYANAIGAAATKASIGFGLTNNNAISFTDFNLSYLGRQWRTNTTTPGNLTVEYKLGGTFDNADTGWTSIPNLTFTGPNITGATSIDGYLTANTVSLSADVSYVVWNTGTTLWVRWRDTNDSGTDGGLAVDDVSFSASAVPEPSTWALIGLGSAFLLWRTRRKNSAV
jgi:hypothetical protein